MSLRAMKHPRESNPARTLLTEDTVGAFAPVSIRHPPGTYALTPASTVCLRAICEHQDLFAGIGIDWGCGTGCLGIVAARIPAVRRVVGLELSDRDVNVARENAAMNEVADKVTFLRSDSFRAFTSEEQDTLDRLEGQVDFLVANPPASHGDDGFELRRVVLAGAPKFLMRGAHVTLQISIQYGWPRILGLVDEAVGLRHEGVLVSTPWVPFDLCRRDLGSQIDDYVAEEDRGGLEYRFGDPRTAGETSINAHTALELFNESGVSPLTKWQVHLFSFEAA